MTGKVFAPLVYRVAYPPRVPTKGELARRSPERAEELLAKRPRTWRRPAVLAVDVRVDAAQRLDLGAWSLFRFRDEVAAGFVLPDDVAPEAEAHVRAWAKARPVECRLVREHECQVHLLSAWREEVLRPYVVGSGEPVSGAASHAWTVTWEGAWVLSRLARDFDEGRGRNYGGWTFGFFDRPPSEDEPEGTPDGHPRLVVRQLSDLSTLLRWGSLPGKGNVPRPGPVLDLRHLVRALAGNGIETLGQACQEFGVKVSLDGKGLEALGDRCRALGELAYALFSECDYVERREGEDRESLRPTGIVLEPKHLYSGGSLAGRLLRSLGVALQSERVVEGIAHNRVVGAFAAALLGGRAEAYVARDTVGWWQHWDFSGDYLHSARLGGVSEFLFAARHVAEDVTAEAIAEYERLDRAADLVGELLDPAWWRCWLVVAVRVRAKGDLQAPLLSFRTPVQGRPGEFLVRHSHVHLGAQTLWTTMADLAAGALADPHGPRAEIVEAFRVRPEGKAEGLRPVVLPGAVTFDPYTEGADIFGALFASRQACASHKGWAPKVCSRRAAMVKGIAVGLASGAVARVDRDPVPQRPGRRNGAASEPEAVVIGPDGEEVPAGHQDAVERPGPDFLPYLAAAVTAGSRLLLALAEAMAGGRVSQVLTDALTVSAEVDMAAVARRLNDGLGVVLRPQYGSDKKPLRAYVAGRNRYIFSRRGALVHVSEFALGGVYLPPTGSEERGLTGAYRWVEETALAVIRTDDGNDLGELALPSWAPRWAVSRFHAATKEQLGWLGEGARPFDQGLAAHNGWRFSPEGGHLVAPVARAPWSTPPEQWPALDWRTRDGGLAIALSPEDRGLPIPDGFEPLTIANAIDRWARTGEPGKFPAWHMDGYGAHRGQLDPLPVEVVGRPLLIGREGTEIAERQRGTSSLEEPVLLYGGVNEAEMEAVMRIFKAMMPEDRAHFGLPASTARYVAAGRVPRKFVEVVRRAAVKSVYELESPPEDQLSRLCAWAEELERCHGPGCQQKRDSRSLYCATCRKAQHRSSQEAYVARRREVADALA